MRLTGRSTLLCVALVVPRLLGAQAIHGTVSNAATGYPVAAVAVSLVGEGNVVVARARSDTSGQYRFEGVTPGAYHLRFLVPGYQATLSQAVQLAHGQVADVSPKLTPLTAFALDTVVVKGERVPRYMEDFYQRRGEGFGTFLTQQDIAKHWPTHVTDLTHHLPGFTLMYDRSGHPKVTNSRFYGLCQPVVFLDGVDVGSEYDLDLVNPEQIVGVESYPSVADIPVVFNAPGSACGVIVIWTKR
jgi:hypothetical protein